MNPIAATLDLLLAALLLAALFVGLRLERRLKVLRESQSNFMHAVTDLDTSVLRAEQSLAELKALAGEAQASLQDLIQDSKSAAVKLERQIAGANAASDLIAARLAARPAPVRTEPPSEVLSLTRPVRGPDQAAPPRADNAVSDVPPARSQTVTPLRSPVRVDDDLFEAPRGSAERRPAADWRDSTERPLRFASGERR